MRFDPILGFPGAAGAGGAAQDELQRRAEQRGPITLTEAKVVADSDAGLGRKFDQEVIRREGRTATEYLVLRTLQVLREGPGVAAHEAQQLVLRDLPLRAALDRERRGLDPVALERAQKAGDASRTEYARRARALGGAPLRLSELEVYNVDGSREIEVPRKRALCRLFASGNPRYSGIRIVARGVTLLPSDVPNVE